MIVVSRFTPDYSADAKTLRRSCEKFGLASHIEQVESTGSWRENERKKPRWIIEALFNFRRPILWLDADCEIKSLPSLFFGAVADFAAFNWHAGPTVAHHFVQDPTKLRVSAGVLLWNYTAHAIDLLFQWSMEVDANESQPTDPMLDRAFNMKRPPQMRVLWLPRSYNRMQQFAGTTPVIDHRNGAMSRLHERGLFGFPSFYNDIIAKLPENFKAVEVGSWLGDSAIHFAKMADTLWKSGTLTCVDTWEGTPGEAWMDPVKEHYDGDLYGEFLKRVDAAGVGQRIQSIRKPSLEACQGFEDGSLDFVMIDADHSAGACEADIRAWLPKVKDGGVLAGDDYDTKSHPGVPVAVDKVFNGQVKVEGRVWWVKQSSELAVAGVEATA